jgi:methylated-DNA-[protein]-cysteine S-methyltransferase
MSQSDEPAAGATAADRPGRRPEGPRGTAPATATHGRDDEPADIIVAANQPDVDPCDVVCDALPALSCGDLSSSESDWIADHVADCSYCARELNRYQNVCSCLDQVYRESEVGPCPVPRFLPTKPVAWYTVVSSPVGPLFVAATNDALVEIEFSKGRDERDLRRHLSERGFEPRPLAAAPHDGAGPSRRVIDRVTQQLSEYFGGRRNSFDLPLDFSGLPEFTREVLTATANVPFGKLDTYRGIAAQIGKPSATRAVGNALNRNPVPVVVPCHRIIRSDGSAGGYGGGLDVKFRLLAHEGVMMNWIKNS